MAVSRPIVGVTTSGAGFRAHFTWLCFRLGVWLAGGRAVRLTSSQPQETCAVDALILSGGTDLHPELYGNLSDPNYAYDEARDAMERQWFARAMDRDLPILGICRGAQLINVVLGGQLHTDLTMLYEEHKYPATLIGKIVYRKSVVLEEGSLLASIFGMRRLRVNSLHHQAIDRLGDPLTVTGTDHLGIIQGIEHRRYPHLVGVQWHPEYMLHSKTQRRILRWLVRQAHENAAHRSG